MRAEAIPTVVELLGFGPIKSRIVMLGMPHHQRRFMLAAKICMDLFMPPLWRERQG